jgi:hypothetical protein
MAKSTNVFKCCKCTDSKEMTHKKFIEHLSEVHQIDASKTKCTRQMLSHMDGATWFSSTYMWTLPDGLQFSQCCWNERAKNDFMRFEH